MVTTKGLFTQRRVLTRVLNATGYYQATMGDVWAWYILYKICLVWVDHSVIWGKDSRNPFEATVGSFKSPAGAWAFCCSTQGRFIF